MTAHRDSPVSLDNPFDRGSVRARSAPRVLPGGRYLAEADRADDRRWRHISGSSYLRWVWGDTPGEGGLLR